MMHIIDRGQIPASQELKGTVVLRKLSFLWCCNTDAFTEKKTYNIVLLAIIDRFTAIKGIVYTFVCRN